MARQRKPPADVVARRERVWDADCNGLTTREIAVQEGVDQSQIVRDLQAIRVEREAARKAAGIARDELAADRARERYRKVIREAWTEWERSKKDKQRRKDKASQKGNGEASTEAEQVTEGRLGDPQYLLAVIRSQTRLDALEGVDAPTRHAIGGDPNAPPVRTKSEDDLNPDINAVRTFIAAVVGAGGPPVAPDSSGQRLDTSATAPQAGTVPLAR